MSPQLPAVERLALAVAASFAVHAAALFVPASSLSGWDLGRLPSGSERHAVLEVRLVQEPPVHATLVALPGASPGPTLPEDPRMDTAAAAGTAPDPHAQGQGIALIQSPKYYRATELDVRPQIRTRVMPAYPAELKDVAGTVVIHVFINEAGTVDDVTVSQAKPAGLFEDSAVAALRSARFTPGVKNGKAVKSRIVLEVTYGPAGDPGGASDRQ